MPAKNRTTKTEKKWPEHDIMLLNLMTVRLDDIKRLNSVKYFEDNRRYFKLLLEAAGNIRVSKITKFKIYQVLSIFSRDLLKRGKTNHRANGMLRAFKSLFNWGIKFFDLNIENPTVGIKFFPVEIKLKHIPPTEEI